MICNCWSVTISPLIPKVARYKYKIEMEKYKETQYKYKIYPTDANFLSSDPKTRKIAQRKYKSAMVNTNTNTITITSTNTNTNANPTTYRMDQCGEHTTLHTTIVLIQIQIQIQLHVKYKYRYKLQIQIQIGSGCHRGRELSGCSWSWGSSCPRGLWFGCWNMFD